MVDQAPEYRTPTVDNSYSRDGLFRQQEAKLEALDLALDIIHQGPFKPYQAADLYLSSNKVVATIKVLTRSQDKGVSLAELLAINGAALDDPDRRGADKYDLVVGDSASYIKTPSVRIEDAKYNLSELVERSKKPYQPLRPLGRVISGYLGKYPTSSPTTPSGIKLPRGK